MCGIFGFWDLRAETPQGTLARITKAMSDSLAHRGPDGDGVWTDPSAGIALGHRRLAIIDLSETGRQPMASASGRYHLTYNGEIYNFRELRAELEAQGAVFRGTSDSEVLLAAVDQWGLQATIDRLVGMFAFALWDSWDRRLALVRDRLGIKPLYFGRVGSSIVFASELRAFAAHPAWDPAVDRQALSGLMRVGYVPAPLSIFRGIGQLRPGHVAMVGADGLIDQRCYWDVRRVALDAAGSGLPAPDTEEVEALLSDAVACRMVADRPVGAFLSGGIDSSAVVALMQRASPQPVRTFTIGFADIDYDESAHARRVAHHLGTDHAELTVDEATALAVVPRLPDLFDEPFADASQIPTFLVAEMARREVVVTLSGDGGDEVFAGYNRHRMAARLGWALRRLPRAVRRAVASALAWPSPDRWDNMAALLPAGTRPRQAGDKLHKLARLLSVDDRAGLYPSLAVQWPLADAPVVGVADDPAMLFAEDESGLSDDAARMQLRDMLTYLPGDILTKVDRATMAVGLEARVPLLDHRVVELAWRLPLADRLGEGTTKLTLRRILHRHVPRELVERPKSGFAVPIHDWLRGPLRDWAEDLLSEQALAGDGVFNVPPIRRLWAEHLSGQANRQYALWPVLMYQAWHRRWMGGVAGSTPRSAAG